MGHEADPSTTPTSDPANQVRAEDMPPTPAHGAERGSGTTSAPGVPADPTTTDPSGRATPIDPTPTMDAAPGGSGDLTGTEDRPVRPAVAVPGKPDGEVDTRM